MGKGSRQRPVTDQSRFDVEFDRIFGTKPKATQELTEKQQRVLDFIKGFLSSRHRTPTYSEIADNFGWSINNSVFYIESMIKKGYLIKVEPRYYRVAEEIIYA